MFCRFPGCETKAAEVFRGLVVVGLFFFFYCNRETVDVSSAALRVKRKECACESKCPREAGYVLPRAADGQLQRKMMGHLCKTTKPAAYFQS